MPKNPKQKEGIESGRDVKDPGTKGRDRIWARSQRTRIKTNGSNLGAMSENPKKNQGIESMHNVKELETKERDRIWA